MCIVFMSVIAVAKWNMHSGIHLVILCFYNVNKFYEKTKAIHGLSLLTTTLHPNTVWKLSIAGNCLQKNVLFTPV